MRHLKIYRAIRLIHRCGSIRQAAAQLAISPSALNRSVQAFEEELSFAVFERVPNGVRLSEAGELLLDLIDRHLIEFNELQAQLGHLRDGETGALRISIGTDIAAGAAIACVSKLERLYPGLSVEVIYDNSVDSLRKRHVQLALLTNPVTDDTTEVIYAWDSVISAWQARDAPSEPQGLWDLADRRVFLPPEGTGARTAISHALRRSRINLRMTSTVSAAQVSAQLPDSNGVALFPETIVYPNIAPAGCRKLALQPARLQCCVLRILSVPLARPAQAFLGLLQKAIEGSGPDQGST